MILETQVQTNQTFNDATHSRGESYQFNRSIPGHGVERETCFSLTTGYCSYLFFFRHDGALEGRAFA